MKKPFTTLAAWRGTQMALLLGAALFITSCERPEEEENINPSAVSQNGQDDDDDDDEFKTDESLVLSTLLAGKAGGNTTVMATGMDAFFQPAANLSGATLPAHQAGKGTFERTFELALLDPIWLQDACVDCHVGGGRSRAPRVGTNNPQLLFRLSVPGQDAHGENNPVPGFGTQLQNIAIDPVTGARLIGTGPEGNVAISFVEETRTLKGGASVSLRRPSYAFTKVPAGVEVSARIGSNVAGLGLLQAVPEATILYMAFKQWEANQDKPDKNKATGKANYVWDYTLNKRVLGRFGWKAGQPSLLQQNAGALNGDMAITTPLFSIEPGESAPRATGVDLTAAELEAMTKFTTTMGVPAVRQTSDNKVLKEGLTLFIKAGCDACHVPRLQTGNLPGFPEVSNQTITPFTDLLVHDMGPELADNRPEFMANGREWRTAPLWGLGLSQITSGHTFLLHDGRARNVTEAVLWHGGEAQKSREFFQNEMDQKERDQLLAFIQSL
ncbi:di-heme oxidoredictase family protein [Hymenobacter sp.]|uniref:di-heme oxidoreductase family protein n=1 Tax=Hymenobacter sp. TaxID=1898978 RepID=UPI00286A82F0|nr:di-heme oxidoredictase family protein [Hymenobacter sp.]